MVVMVATDAAMVATAAATATARGLLMLMPWLRLATAAAMVVMVATDAAMVATVATVTDVDTARGRLRLSPATDAAATAVDMAAMVVTVVAMAAATATARGLLSPAMAMAATD